MHSIEGAADFAAGPQPTANCAVRHHSEHIRALWLDRDLTGSKGRKTSDVGLGIHAMWRVKNSSRARLYGRSLGQSARSRERASLFRLRSATGAAKAHLLRDR